ncbi:MAG: hypothetical protein A4E72_01334 [Syntrophus sp. PtaU1.Bin208]|nr:MAG: hypothetical protein A4E72_01334 [Syntrophus sp. PtaU1.Bin208]
MSILKLINDETTAIDKTTSRAQHEIELMQEYRARLISDVVTGKVDVRGIEVPEISEDELQTWVEETPEEDDLLTAESEREAEA